MMNKFLGRTYDEYEVVGSYVANKYKKCHGKAVKAIEHRSYNYVLVNKALR